MIAHGIDITEVPRIASMLRDHGDAFWTRVYTPAERSYCEANPARCPEHAAARFAAKEAVFKALGTGWAGGVAWTDCEVVHEPSGRPAVVLRGRALEIARAMGITRWSLSLTHTESQAAASAIAS
ncbi:MAG: holo-ACP synthase [Phycisphaeraceae bacterium]|nr:MAG: holo-ACP synthase [Phycisphaeraceae bacterium]